MQRGNPQARIEWAVDQLMKAARATKRLGLSRHVTMSGGLAWPFLYPYPPRPDGLSTEAFAELARRWQPVLNAFDAAGATVGFELHPGEDVHDGASFERFLAATGNHARVAILYDPSHLFLQHIDYAGFIDVYHQRINSFHVKDAEWNMSARTGVYAGFVDWTRSSRPFPLARRWRYRLRCASSRNWRQFDFDGWASLEWECCLKHPDDGAREGAQFIDDHIIRVQSRISMLA